MIKLGDSGAQVSSLQLSLNGFGYNLAVGGQFGPATEAAVKLFQAAHGLSADGVVGPQTQAALSGSPVAAFSPQPVTQAPSQVLWGIDLYSGDNVKSVAEIKAAGCSFVMQKAYEFREDSSYASRRDEFLAQGMPFAPYDFFHPEGDAMAQAKAFCAIVGSVRSGEFTPWLDWEQPTSISASVNREAGYVWLQEVEQLLGVTPGIYGGPYYLGDLSLDSRFERFPLWTAEYGSKSAKIPQPWSKYTFWQCKDNASIQGMGNPCDYSIFNGSSDDLKAMIKA